MSRKTKIFSSTSPRCVVRWLRNVPSHEAMMLGIPEIPGMKLPAADAGLGRCFWQS
jgi:hypothetical protein